MHVFHFNGRAFADKHSKARRAATVKTSPPVESVLDTSFDDMGGGNMDVHIAPGLLAHPGALGAPSDEFMFATGMQTSGYHATPTLERTAEAA